MATTKNRTKPSQKKNNSQQLALSVIESGKTTQQQALDLFDSLPVVDLEFMYGTWAGTGVHTGHAMDGLLENYRWYGKQFISPDKVHPLVFKKSNGKFFQINPALMPLGMALSQQWLKKPFMRFFFNLGRPVLSTRKTTARLRMTELRGKVSATMCYDALPIHDVFRKVDENTVLGYMDYKRMDEPFFFTFSRIE